MDLMFGEQCLMKCIGEVFTEEPLPVWGRYIRRVRGSCGCFKKDVMMIRRKSLINGITDATAIERIYSIFGCEKVLAI
jgi:hypothetical protein